MTSSAAAPIVLALIGSASLVLGSAASSCSTPDPHAGTRRESSASSGGTSSSGGSSSGGIDATAPAGPIDCGPAPATTTAFTKQALLAAAGACAGWNACNFLNAATTLKTSVHEQAATPSPEKLASARTSWKAAMNEWSKMELFQFGPVGSKALDPYHGRGLRSFVSPWPQTNRCEVEKQVATKGYQQGIGNVLPSGRGLYALEYLLFYENADTACLPGSAAGQAWTALASADLAKAKSEYSVAVADNVLALALEIRNVWLPEGENFASKLAALEGYGSEQEALNVIGYSLFYIERDVKDLKVASRAGVDPTPPNPETPFALVEIENIRTNLRAFRSLFQGCGADGAGLGFDDWLSAAGQASLANEILAALAQAQATADAFPAFSSATKEQFMQLYDSLKTLSTILKTRLFGSGSPLNLKLPAGVASDTD